MNHREFVDRLHDYHFGALADAERTGVDEHLAGCAECRALSKTYLVLHGAIEAQRRPSTLHPTADDLVDLVLFPERMSDGARARLEAHLGSCDPCSDDLSRVREARRSVSEAEHAVPGRRDWTSAFRRPTGWIALAASLLAAALLYPAFLGLYRYPALQSRTTEWTGPVDVFILSSAMRDDSAPPELVVDAAAPVVIVGIEFDVPAEAANSDGIRVTLTDANATPVVDLTMSVADAREAFRTAGLVTLLVPATRLLPGAYRVAVVHWDGQTGTTVMESRFSVAGPSNR